MAHMTSSNLGNKKFLYAAVFSLPVFLLVFVQPDLGSMVVLALGVLGVFLGSGLHFLWVVGGGIAAFVLSPLVWHFLADYQKQRIITFFSPQDDPLGAGYNVLQAMIAVGSGGLWGRGLGQGTQSQLAFLPERHTDFIFSALSEELGLAGGLLVIFAFSVLFARIIILLKKKEDLFSQSFLTGIFFILFIQVVINIGMNLGVLPVAGVPLPLVSSGGSSLLTTAASLGMVSSLSSDLKRPQF
jgi:rod shape determining protein RodA